MEIIIQTNKGYICEKNAIGCYERKDCDFYRVETGKWFTSTLAGTSEVDKLGFTDKQEEATRYCGCIGNRVQEICDRIKHGFENITEIKILVIEI